jgi:hypothetical protein
MRWRGVMLGLLFLLVGREARAQLSASAGVEHFAWTEKTSPLEVRERGSLFACALGFALPRERGLRIGYRGGYQIGLASYEGSFLYAPNVPARGTSVFAATMQEAQLRYRSVVGIEAIGSLALELWHRELGPGQAEDYRAVWVRLSLEGGSSHPRGWRGGGGVRIPLSIREDAHFTRLGFDQNPTLEPTLNSGLFGQLGYRFAPHWACVGSLDGFALRKSPEVLLTRSGASQSTSFQPATTVVMLGLRLEYTW